VKRKDSVLFIFYRFFANSALFVPIIVVFLKYKTHSSARALSIIGVYSLVIMLAELPTGVIADTFGTKRTTLLGVASAILGSLVLGYGNTYSVLLLGEILIAISVSLRSGADSAFLFGISPDIGAYKKYESFSNSARYIALCTSSLAGSFLFGINKELPFVTSSIMFAAGFLFASFIPEKNLGKSIAGKGVADRKMHLNEFKKLFRIKGLIPIIILSALTGVFFSTVYWLVQPYLQSVGFPEKFFGLVYALSFVSSAFGSFVSGKIRFKERNNYLQIVWLGVAGMLIPVFLYLFRSPTGILFLLLNQFLIGFSYPVIFSAIQKKIGASKLRATALSLESLIQRLFLTIMIFFISTAISCNGIGKSLLLADFVLSVLFIVSLYASYTSSRS